MEGSALKIRIKFTKQGSMKFIGHLDMMRYFQKAMRRANIDIKYSAGYSPHQIMSFAAPLGVGITSEGEYFDIEVNETLSSREAIKKLNEVMVDGVVITEYKLLPDNAKPAMSLVAAADYFLCRKDNQDDFWNQIEDFRNQKQILITKKTKKSEIELDLKEFLFELMQEERSGKKGVFMRLSSGSVQNIKPELIVEAYEHFLGTASEPYAIQEHRVEVYTENENGYQTLGSMGEDIG